MQTARQGAGKRIKFPERQTQIASGTLWASRCGYVVKILPRGAHNVQGQVGYQAGNGREFQQDGQTQDHLQRSR